MFAHDFFQWLTISFLKIGCSRPIY